MPRLSAFAIALSTATAATASPFVLERLIATGDLLPGTDSILDTIGIPTINSHGQWAVPVRSENTLSGIWGNDGYRIGLDQDPDGSPLTSFRLFNSASLNDHGDLAVGALIPGTSAAYVNGELAAIPATVSGTLYHVDINNGGFLRSTASSPNFSHYYSVSAMLPDGEWGQSVFSGSGVQTPLGLVSAPVTGQSRAAVSNNGDLIYAARFEQTQPDGSTTTVEGVALNDEFIAVNGQPSPIDGYGMSGLRGAGAAFNAASDYAYVSGLVPSSDPGLPAGNALFINNEFAFGDATFTENPELSDVYDHWSIDPRNFAFDNDHNVLWQAIAFGQSDPNLPTQFDPAALMYNDQIIARAGQTMTDGLLIWSFYDLQMSEDGTWGLVMVQDIDTDLGISRRAAYRFQIPAPGAATLMVLAGLMTGRRRR